MKEKYSTPLFLVLLIFVLGVAGTLGALSKRPQAIHLWSQADRASVALNYAQDNMDFFKPRVHYTKQDNGVTGMEFPVMNYLAAICYKVFGFNELWYRLLMLIVVCAGVFSSFLLAKDAIGNYFLASAVVLFWFLSPTLVYYTPNFIPDAASLGLILVSWLFYFRFSNKMKYTDLVLFVFFACLATLIKITSLISIITILSITFLKIIQNLRKKSNGTLSKDIILVLGCLLVLIPVYSWYHYAEYLNQINQHGIFTLDYHPVTSFAELKDISLSIYHQWFYSYYSPLFFIVLIISAIYIAINFKIANRKLVAITFLLYLGDLFFILLMFKQFRNHDYYIITLLPAPLFQLITAAKIFLPKHIEYRRKLLVIYAFVLTFSLFYARNDEYKRYHGWQYDKKWDYSAFYGMDQYLRTKGINKEDKVIVIYDGSFDISLYFMNVKGWTMWPGNDETNYFKEAIKNKVEYIILRNPEFLEKNGNYSQYFNNKIGDYNGIAVYKVN